MIDRGEDQSYLPIWELVEYIGQGSTYTSQVQTLKEAWEKCALENSTSENKELMRALFPQGVEKSKAYDTIISFLRSLVACLIPLELGRFDSNLADQFTEVVKNYIAEGNIDVMGPDYFIDEAFKDTNEDRKFTLWENCPEFDNAANLLMSISHDQWEFGKEIDVKSAIREIILNKGENHSNNFRHFCDPLLIQFLMKTMFTVFL